METEKSIKTARKHLGKKISKCRKNMKPAELAKRLGISRSYMKGIEDGISTPSPEMYKKMIQVLMPTDTTLKQMDRLYMTIRKAPPPDICEIFSSNPDWIEVFRSLKNSNISAEQIKQMADNSALLQTGSGKGESKNA